MAFVPDPPPAAGRFVPDEPASVAGVSAGTGEDALSTVKDLATVTGPLEAAANVGTSVVGGFPAYLGGGLGTILARAAGASDRDPQEMAEEISRAFTYQPRTDAGKRLTEKTTLPLRKLQEGAKAAGEATADKTGSAGLAALVDSTIQMIPGIFGLRATRGEGAPTPRPTAGKRAGAPREPAAPPVERPFPGEAPAEPAPAPKVARAAPSAPEPPPFPEEAGNLDDVLPPVPAGRFVPDPPAAPRAAPEGMERLTAAADAIARGEDVDPATLRDFPALAELQRAKRVLADAQEAKRAKFALNGQTEAEIRAEEAAARRAADEKARIEAAPPPESFGLTGSDRPVDEARAAGQMELEEPVTPEQDARDAAQVERSRKASARARARMSSIDPSKDDLPTIVGKGGGISRQALIDLGLDPADVDRKTGYFKSTNPFVPAVRSKGGLTLDGVAELLDQHGFQVRDEYGAIDSSIVGQLIEDHMTGRRVFAPEGYEAYAAAEDAARAEVMAKDAEREAAEGGPVIEPDPEPLERPPPASDAEALERFGPGTMGANAFLNPKLIADTGRAVVDAIKEGAGEVFASALGQPGEHRTLFRPIRDSEQLGVARIERWATGEGHDLRKAFPSKAEREKLTRRIVTNNLEGLTPEQEIAAKRLQANYQTLGQYALAAERIDGLRQNYSPQIWDLADRKTRDILDGWRAAHGKEPIDAGGALAKAMQDARIDPSKLSPFMLERTIPDVVTGMRLGLKPKSLDAADLFETYARSMASAVERGKTLDALANLRDPDGNPMVIPREQAPRDYQRVNNPELEGLRIHPDIAPDVRVLLETNDPWLITKIWQTAAYTSKRALVSYSMFHPKALLEAYVGTGGNPATVKGAIDRALQQYRDGGLGDELDKGLAAGLRIGAPLEDVLGRDRFKTILDRTADVLDKVNAGKPIRVAKDLDEHLQRLTWDYIHTGLKIDTFLRKYADESARNARALAKGEITDHEIARQAAEFANATYGGLNWERMLDSFDTPTARRIMSEVLSKAGRSTMQSTLFAPDWMVSSLGSWTNAIGASERNAVKRRLAQRYIATSAVVFFSVGNALNYYFTGHSMFENRSNRKDATYADNLKAKLEVQLGDGRRLQIGKHFTELPHAVLDPLQFAANKLNPTVSTPAELFFNKQWLAPGGYSPSIWKNKDPAQVKALKAAEHVGSKVVPIAGSQFLDQGPAAGVGGFFGFPVYGMTEEQKRDKRGR